MTAQIPHFIDGQRSAGQSGRTAEVFDPSTARSRHWYLWAARARSTPRWPRRRRRNKSGRRSIRSAAPGVMMRFIQLVTSISTSSPRCCRASTARRCQTRVETFSAGIDVIEFCVGIPHLLKGEYSEGAGPGIDVYSLRQPLGVVAGITPFNFRP